MPNATDEEMESTYAGLGRPIAVYGHIHRSYVRSLRGMTVVNSGSVSLSYDGDPRASYLLLDGSKATIRRVPYDIEAEAVRLCNPACPMRRGSAKRCAPQPMFHRHSKLPQACTGSIFAGTGCRTGKLEVMQTAEVAVFARMPSGQDSPKTRALATHSTDINRGLTAKTQEARRRSAARQGLAKAALH